MDLHKAGSFLIFKIGSMTTATQVSSDPINIITCIDKSIKLFFFKNANDFKEQNTKQILYNYLGNLNSLHSGLFGQNMLDHLRWV